MRFLHLFSFVLCWNLVVNAQGHEPVFPELIGEELLERVKQDFKPNVVLTYAEARDTLWAKILSKNDSLSCLYTSYTIYLDPEKNPRADAFEKGINAEHIWPRSKGASGLIPTADMHHIMPSREGVNNDRGNLPFEELTVANTRFWYYLDNKRSAPPTQNIELHSQLGQESFTPPVHMRGDVARSMLYFYAMYTEEADQADPLFFELQRETFCKWHFDDPVDEAEWQKTKMIAPYQEFKANPFILDCTLPERSFCQDYNENCTPVISSTSNEVRSGYYWSVFPNPTTSQHIHMEVTVPNLSRLEWVVYDHTGRMVANSKLEEIPQGTHLISMNDSSKTASLVPGFYILQLRIQDRDQVVSLSKKLIIH